jgi:hypothetical protein
MKRNIVIATCFVLGCGTLTAQTSTQRIYIKGGSSARENFMKEVFMYPAFQQGLVEYKNGQRYKSSLNYNKVLGTVQFIDEKGDTLVMINEESISSIVVGSDEFVYKPACLLAIKRNEKASLYKNELVRIADAQKTGGYDIPNSTGTIQSVDRIDTRVNFNQIEINEKLLISKVTTFYLENQKGEILPASKKNVLNMYPKHEEAIKSFIKSKTLDLNREEHLVELTDFIATL